MARSARPRKAYRPKSRGAPITGVARDSLVLPGLLALSTLQNSADAAALKVAADDLAAILGTAREALSIAGREVGPVEDGMRAMVAVIERRDRVDTWRASGPELQALWRAVIHYDQQLGMLRAHHIVGAVQTYLETMAVVEAAEGGK